jgi:hypothetical protein
MRVSSIELRVCYFIICLAKRFLGAMIKPCTLFAIIQGISHKLAGERCSSVKQMRIALKKGSTCLMKEGNNQKS